jgi:aminoglycoside phosphotransferase (APT) family kinase protein
MSGIEKEAGLIPVRNAHRFDEEALAEYLARNLPGLGRALSISQFQGGQSNPTFHVSGTGGACVVRKKPPGKLLRGAHAVDREFRVLSALQNSDVPVPRMLHWCEDESIIGTPFYIMEYLQGRILRNPLLPGLQPAERAAIYDAMIDVMARLHSLDWKAAGLEGFGKPDNYIARQVALWSRQYQASKTGEVQAMEQLMKWLPHNIPEDESSSVVHGDFRLENLMFDPVEPRVTAVLDWELSTLGHPLSDLSFNCMTYYLPSTEKVARGFVGSDLEALGIPSEKAYVSSYCARTGRDRIDRWTFFMVFSLFRTAAIQQGVYARALRGNASSPTAHRFGALYPVIAERGWALVENL